MENVEIVPVQEEKLNMRHLRRASLIIIPALLACYFSSISSQRIMGQGVEPKKSKPLSRFAGNPRTTPVVKLVQAVRGSVVNIHSERLVRGEHSRELFALAPSARNRIKGMGTGIVIDPRGYIVTNHHVIEEVNLIRIRLANGTTTDARVIARDAANDLALLKIKVDKPLPVMPFGTARDLMVGETVVAIGNAYGYDHTVTVGVISATRRDVKLNKEISYRDLIQTDASINPGNSGGPLFNIRGELIGVNVAIRAGAQGIGFAIPVDTMIEVTGRMLREQRQRRLSLGLQCRNRVTLRGEEPAERSLVVERVMKDSPARKAGLLPGDHLVRAGSHTVTTAIDLERALLSRSVGDRLDLMVRRGKDLRRLALNVDHARPATLTADQQIWNRLGARLQKVAPDKVSQASQQLHGGLFVAQIRRGSSADRAGIQAGDILVGLHQWEMLQPDNVTYVLQHPDLARFSPMRFYIVRSGQIHRGWLQPE